MNRIKRLAFGLLLLLFVTDGKTQGFLRAQGRLIVNEKGEKVILRGMGLGWMLQESYTADALFLP